MFATLAVRTSKPPLAPDIVIVSNDTQLDVGFPQMKPRTIWSIWSHIPYGIKQFCITYVGMVEITHLAKVAHPARFKSFCFQTAYFPWIFSMMKLKYDFFALPIRMGKQSYLSILYVWVKPRMESNLSTLALGTFLDGRNLDFWILILNPAAN